MKRLNQQVERIGVRCMVPVDQHNLQFLDSDAAAQSALFPVVLGGDRTGFARSSAGRDDQITIASMLATSGWRNKCAVYVTVRSPATAVRTYQQSRKQGEQGYNLKRLKHNGH